MPPIGMVFDIFTYTIQTKKGLIFSLFFFIKFYEIRIKIFIALNFTFRRKKMRKN